MSIVSVNKFKINKLSLIILLLQLQILISNTAAAQKGSIQGVVTDKTNTETLAGASVFIPGTTTGTTTDFDGNFSIHNLNPGNYSLQVSFISYNPVIIDNVVVSANKITIISVDLEEVTTQLEGVVVATVRRTNTDMALVSAIRANPTVANGISAQQISLSQDKDASEAVRRVPGISIMGGRFIVVRGLNQRYNNVWINNASTPSTEADQKAFSFDLIPSYMIDNLIIAKSPAPDLPADFAGGFVKIFTKIMPDEDFFRVSYGNAYNDQTTFQTLKLTPGGKLDWLGIDDGTRNLPGNFPKTLKGLSNLQLVEYGRSLNNYWDAEDAVAIPNQSISINYGKKFQRGNKQIGTITALNYSLTNESDDIINSGYQSGRTDGINPDSNYDYIDNEYSRTAKLGLLHNWAFFPGKSRKLEFRNMLNMIGKNQSTIRNGFMGYEGRTIRSYENSFMSRLTYSGQLNGERKFNDEKSGLDWNAGFAYANRNEPDLKRLRTTLFEDEGSANHGMYFAAVGTSPSSSDAGRVFMQIDEYIASASINLERKFNFFERSASFKVGNYNEYKYRTFDARILGFAKNSPNPESVWITPINSLFSDENINNGPEGFTLRESTSKSDSYVASNLQIALYALVNIPLTKKIKVYGGVRAEQNNQHLNSFDRYNKPVEIVKDNLGFFPSVNLTYSFNEKNLLRFGYGITTNQPEFREIAPFYFYNFQEEADYVGNVNLIDATIQNLDLRYELYPNAGELFSVGLFYKDFANPIEVNLKPAGNRKNYTFGNALRSTSLGSEIELRKSLDVIDLLKCFSVVANGAYIISNVYFPEGSIERDRAMQGQSPYLVNMGIFYSNEKQKLNISLLYNLIGDRILIIGEAMQEIANDIPDIYEQHRHLLDLLLTKKFAKRYEFRFGIKDILNQNAIWYQPYAAVNGGENLFMINKQSSPGRTFSFSLSIDLK